MGRALKIPAGGEEKRPRGRPRKYQDEQGAAARYAEARRLEVVRDEAAAAAVGDPTMARKVALLSAEYQLMLAWASALRADGSLGPAGEYTDRAVRLAGAHAKAVEQLQGDRLEELHALVVRRASAAARLDLELGEAGPEGVGVDGPEEGDR